MKKLIFLVLSLLGFMTMNVQAQISVGATVGLQVPTGDFADAANMGLGFTIIGKYMVKDNLALGASVGYSQFGTDKDGLNVNYSIIPITGLIEYHFGEGSLRPYVGADLGVYTLKTHIKFQGASTSDSKSNFGFAPTGGLIFGKSESLSFVVNAKYNYIMGDGNFDSWIGINFGAFFKL